MARFRRNITAQHHYRSGDYNPPNGYSYRRYTYGERLPSQYFIRSFWITNFFNFGLMPPPDGYVWVRYGNDAVLIDEYTGEIVEIVYDQFY